MRDDIGVITGLTPKPNPNRPHLDAMATALEDVRVRLYAVSVLPLGTSALTHSLERALKELEYAIDLCKRGGFVQALPDGRTIYVDRDFNRD